MQAYITRVEAALSELRQGKMIILTDHPDREDEGDIIFPAEIVTADMINFMIRHCSGIICLSLTSEQIKKLGLTAMVGPNENSSQRKTPFTVSIEAKSGISTGVSAQDRATTILTAVKEGVTSDDLVKPGHIFPLHAQDGGVFTRQGHTEGAVDIVRLAGFQPAAVLCEVMNPDGTMARGQQLREFAAQHHLTLLSIDDLIAYRRLRENLISDEVIAQLPLANYGTLSMSVIKDQYSHDEHVILSKPHDPNQPPLVRIHSSCVTGDIFGSLRCDCHQQLHYSLERISQEGGIVIYLAQEGRGIGLFNKIKAYSLQENGMDTAAANEHLGFPIDAREYYIAANILRNKQLQHIRLLTNNLHKIENLQKYGIKQVEREAMPGFGNEFNIHYLQTKNAKLNHDIHIDFSVPGDKHA